jgi:hypothetical protein
MGACGRLMATHQSLSPQWAFSCIPIMQGQYNLPLTFFKAFFWQNAFNFWRIFLKCNLNYLNFRRFKIKPLQDYSFKCGRFHQTRIRFPIPRLFPRRKTIHYSWWPKMVHWQHFRLRIWLSWLWVTHPIQAEDNFRWQGSCASACW